MSSRLERIIELLDEALMYHRPQRAAMTSQRRSHAYAAGCDGEFSGVTESLQPDDDSVRPKSFLHDEVDEFNRVLAELLQSRQTRDQSDDLPCSSSWFHDFDDSSWQMTRPDHRRTNSCHQRLSGLDARYDREAAPTHWTGQQQDDDDGEQVDDAGELEIVEETDCRLTTRNICTDDIFNEDDADSGYQSGNSTMVAPHQLSAQLSAYYQLRHRVECYNLNCRSSGLSMTIAPDSDAYQGFIRVHMNLHKPISMAIKSACPVYDVTAVTSARDVITPETESFYLPPNTSKVIHINSEMTTLVVIQTLLDKFLITDPCHKFALYEKFNSAEERRVNGMLRRLTDDEKPLELCLSWSDNGADCLSRRQFLLQDNVTSEIAWDSFSLPELEAFLRILDREEESYCYQIQLKYGAKKKAAQMRLKQLADDTSTLRP